MGKDGTIFGIIGLILGAGGLGLGGYMWISLSKVENQMTNISQQSLWYKCNETPINTNPIFSYISFNGLTIEFTLGHNESAYFTFTALAHLEPDSGWSQIYVYFKVNGIIDTDHYALVGLYNGETASLIITLQYIRRDLSLGVHSVTIVIYGTKTGNYIYCSSLSVQKISW
ncbi:MAG: hypothetical protein ACFFA3_15585 [Promethearchaeota archaeon]